MTAMLRPTVLTALLAVASFGASAADTVRVPVPWKAGQTLAYESESVQRELLDGEWTTRRLTDRTEFRIEAAGRDGDLLTTATYDSRIEAVEGDRTTTDMIAPLLDALDGYGIAIELGRDGRYRRLRDPETVAAKIRTAMLPIFAANLERMIGKPDPKVSKGEQDAALDFAMSRLEETVAALITTEDVEMSSTAQIRGMTAFVGKALKPGRRYRDDEPLRLHHARAPLPAKREYALTLDRDDPNLARIRWTHVLDADGDPAALWRLADEISGDSPAASPREGRPQALAMREEGLLVFRRDTGEIQMLETVETRSYGKEHDERDRSRMRLIGSPRTWAQEEAARNR